jgi:hypothetical protein
VTKSKTEAAPGQAKIDALIKLLLRCSKEETPRNEGVAVTVEPSWIMRTLGNLRGEARFGSKINENKGTPNS